MKNFFVIQRIEAGMNEKEETTMQKDMIFISNLFLIFLLSCADSRSGNTEDKSNPKQPRDINAVMESYTKELMSMEGVVGVYIGALDDGTPCIGVMVVKFTPDLQQKLPKELEGHPVRIEETGEIKPLEE